MDRTDDELTIRPAGLGDYDAVAGLFHQLNPKDLPANEDLKRKTFSQILAQPGLTLLIAHKGQTPVASCTLAVIPNMTRGCAPYALIENVVTHENWRGHGIGKQIMSDAIRRARAAGCFKIMLMSGEDNVKAHRFYEDLGFKTTKKGFELRASGYPKRDVS